MNNWKGNFRLSSALSFGLATLTLWSGPAFARPALDASTGEQESVKAQAFDSDEIIVTAQRREQNLQDVPVSVTAITGADLLRRGALNTFNLEAAVPNLLFSKSTNQTLVTLRGVGSQGSTPGNDPSVPLYVDGVYMSAPPALLFSFNDVERVEVLRGPQGTLFGRNATGGLINVVTRDPTSQLHANVSLGYGSYGRIEGSAYLTGGSDTISASLALIYNQQNDGWGRNLFTPDQAGPITVNGQVVTSPAVDDRAGFSKEFGAHGRILIRPDGDTAIRIDGTYVHNRGDQNLYRDLLPGSIGSANGTTPFSHIGGFYDYDTDVTWLAANTTYIGAINASHNTAFGTIRSITSYLDSKSYTQFDLDGTPQPSNITPLLTSTFKTFTQELQLVSNSQVGIKWLDYTLGLYFYKSRASFDPANFVRGNSLEGRFIRYAHQDTQSLAAFGQVTFHVTDSTRVTGGLRYTRDQLRGEQIFIGTNATATSGPFLLGQISSYVPPQQTTQSAVTFRIAVDQDLTPDIMVYASFNRGYKGGAYNLGALCLGPVPLGTACTNIQQPVKPERLNAYEAGIRSELLNRRLRINLSGFYYDYKDLQAQAFVGSNPPVSILTNAASAKSYGGELEIVAKPARNLNINIAASYLHAKYEDFPGAIGYLPRTAAPYGNSTVTVNAAGKDLFKAPSFTSSVGFNWTIPAGSSTLEIGSNWAHNSGFYWDVLNRVRQPAYDVVNAQASLTLPNQNWRLRVWANNLFGEKYYSFVSVTSANDSGAPAAPRTVGGSITWLF